MLPSLKSRACFRLVELSLARKRRITRSVITPRLFSSAVSTSHATKHTNGSSTTTTTTNKNVRRHRPHLISGNNHLQQRRLEATAVEQQQDEPQYESDLVVVLDMDECLIHSKFGGSAGSTSQRFAHQLSRKDDDNVDSSSSSSHLVPPVDSFPLTLPDGDIVQVHERPYLHEFLHTVCNKYETHVFTAAMEIYAKPILDTLDPTGTLLGGRYWYRNSCMKREGTGGNNNVCFVKDLSFFKKPLERIVLIDNNPLSFLANPNNGILVKSFYEDPHDTTLLGVLELLDELNTNHTDDVRPYLKQKFELKEALEGIYL